MEICLGEMNSRTGWLAWKIKFIRSVKDCLHAYNIACVLLTPAAANNNTPRVRFIDYRGSLYNWRARL